MAKHRTFKIVTVITAILCILCTIPLYYDALATFSQTLVAPRTRPIETKRPTLLHEFSDGVYEFLWSDDALHILLKISNWTSATPDAPDTLVDLNLVTNEVVFQEETITSNEDAIPRIIHRLGIDTESNYWALCAEKNRVIAAGGFESEQYWLKYWENEKLIDTFNFSSEQWSSDSYPPIVSLEFSASCNKVSLILSGWVAYEGDGNEELWMLDTVSQTLERLVVGKSPTFVLWDYPVQHVAPSWSPDEDQFVFGGWTFPLEIYDLSSSKQRILTSPHYNLHSAQWSPSGKWIAAIQSGDPLDRLYVFSSDGSLYSTTQECDLITDFQWAPEEDKILFTCHGECNELCTESCNNVCESDCDDPCANVCPWSDYLWLWDLE